MLGGYFHAEELATNQPKTFLGDATYKALY